MEDFYIEQPDNELVRKAIKNHAVELGFKPFTIGTFENYPNHIGLLFEGKSVQSAHYGNWEKGKITLDEYFALKPEPKWPKTFDDLVEWEFHQEYVLSRNVNAVSYEVLDKIIAHVDEIRGKG